MEGLPGGRIAYVTKIHHAVADGSAAAEIIVRSLQEDDRPVAFPEREDAGNEAVPSAARHLAGSLRREIVRQQEERSAATSTVTESCPSVRSRPRCATRLNLTAWSYLDEFAVGLHPCREHAPDLPALAEALSRELHELGRVAAEQAEGARAQ